MSVFTFTSSLSPLASIDSPGVLLIASGANLEVSIKDPVFRISTLRNVYSVATYNITYWKKGEEKKVGILILL